MEKAHKAALDGLKKSIVVIEDQLQIILKEDQQIKTNYKLLITIPGIGHLTALYIICCTNNFITKVSGKQLASYAGWYLFSTKVEQASKVAIGCIQWPTKSLNACCTSVP